jgi:hypothetical protein
MGKTSIAITDSSDGSIPALAVPMVELADTTIHLTLQGKGGVGKSLVAVILAQYLSKRGLQIQCIDTDPLNRTFAQYNAFAAERIQVRDEHSRIDQRSFDGLLERFLTEHGATFVVDNGASTFLPLWHYLLENRALEYLQEHHCKIYIHTVITGGQALLDTLNGFRELAESAQQRNLVVWVNEYFGPRGSAGQKPVGDDRLSRQPGQGLRRGGDSQAQPGPLWPGHRRHDHAQVDL